MPLASPLLELDRVSVAWDAVEVVHSVSLTVAEGELLTLLGPNGSGKTTLLRAIAGFEPPSSGAVRLKGASLEGVAPHRRSIGLLFQDPALFPHRSVYENIAYAPLLARKPIGTVRDEVADLSRLLGLERLLDRAPDQLSGGERQRVALARTLAARPSLVLLDEPFASVDYEVRGLLNAEFRRALAARGTAAIHVTHDREEGLFLGDRVALLFDGSLEALGEPAEVFAHPPSARVARFLGYNVLPSASGAIAVLPEELGVVAAEAAELGAPGTYTVLSSGTVGRGFRALLGSSTGERAEVRSPTPLPRAACYRLRWERSVRLPSTEGLSATPQSPRGAAP